MIGCVTSLSNCRGDGISLAIYQCYILLHKVIFPKNLVRTSLRDTKISYQDRTVEIVSLIKMNQKPISLLKVNKQYQIEGME